MLTSIADLLQVLVEVLRLRHAHRIGFSLVAEVNQSSLVDSLDGDTLELIEDNGQVGGDVE